jgi:hypothetical protein
VLASRLALLLVTVLMAVAAACGPSTPRATTPFALPTFTAAPIAAAPSPTTTTPVPQPAVSPAPTSSPPAQTLYVANTGGEGVYLRRTPALGDRIKAYPEGTSLTTIGGETQAEGQAWLQVRAPDGTEGWVPQRYTALTPPAPAPPKPAAPTAQPKPAVPGGTARPGSTASPGTIAPAKPTAPESIIQPPATATPRPAPAPPPVAPPPAGSCCRICTTGKACGDGCIPANRPCYDSPGCACNGSAWNDIWGRGEPDQPQAVALGMGEDASSPPEPCPSADDVMMADERGVAN